MSQKIHKEIADLQSELERLDTAVKHIEDAGKLARDISHTGHSLGEKYSAHLKEMKALTTHFETLSERTTKLIERIDAVDFPEQFQKLDNSFNGIFTGLQQVGDRLEKALDKNREGLSTLQTTVQENKVVTHKKISKVLLGIYILGGLMVLNILVGIFG